MLISYRALEEKKIISSGMSEVPEKLAEFAYGQIFSRILTLQIAPGALLQERQLAESLGMSRTPVREALMRLAHEGWVTTNARRYSEVKKLTEQDVREVMEVRRFLELHGLEMIMENRRWSTCPTALARILEQMVELRADPQEYILEDQHFHRVIVSAGENSRLDGFYAQVSFEVVRMGMAGLKARGAARDEIEEEHNNILRGIASGKKKEARAALCHHLDVTRTMIERCIREYY